jgi:pimeloyl-ACP methyl ester carboxylesterase
MALIVGISGISRCLISDSSRTSRAQWLKGLPGASSRDFNLVSIADLLDAESTWLSLTRQIRSYVLDRNVRDRVRERVLEGLGPETRVVVGHSLGSVAAYEALCASTHQVKVFITLGSPLGFRRAIFDCLTSHDWPGALERWVNLADRKDPVAIRRRLRPLFGDGTKIEDVIVNNGLRAHAITSYLEADAVRGTIAQVLAERHLDTADE